MWHGLAWIQEFKILPSELLPLRQVQGKLSCGETYSSKWKFLQMLKAQNKEAARVVWVASLSYVVDEAESLINYVCGPRLI